MQTVPIENTLLRWPRHMFSTGPTDKPDFDAILPAPQHGDRITHLVSNDDGHCHEQRLFVYLESGWAEFYVPAPIDLVFEQIFDAISSGTLTHAKLIDIAGEAGFTNIAARLDRMVHGRE